MQVRGITSELRGLTARQFHDARQIVSSAFVPSHTKTLSAPAPHDPTATPASSAGPGNLLLSVKEPCRADISSAARTEQEAAVNRLKIRLGVASAGLAACGLILSGCGAGQISQTATQEAAVNGTAANVKEIALRNVHLLAEQTSDYLQPGSTVPLLFVAANNSVDGDDKLVGITSEVGTVAVNGDGAIPAGGALIVGSPDGQAQAMGSALPIAAEVALSQPITNGLTYNFIFDFEKAGKVTVAVPISAGEPAPE